MLCTGTSEIPGESFHRSRWDDGAKTIGRFRELFGERTRGPPKDEGPHLPRSKGTGPLPRLPDMSHPGWLEGSMYRHVMYCSMSVKFHTMECGLGNL